jgi:hypothetical protein
LNTDRFLPLVEELKSVSNWIMAVIGIAMIFDLYAGSPLTSQIVAVQMKIMHADPTAAGGFRLVTIFGAFTNVRQLAAVFDKAIAIICLGITGIGYVRALLGAMAWKNPE